MLTKEIEYDDLDGNKVKGTFWFHLSKTDLLEEAVDGSLQAKLERIVAGEASQKEILETFKEFLRKTIGERSVDGKRFTRTPEAVSAFLDSDAYATLLFELMSDAGAAAEFINGAMPKDLNQFAEEIKAKMEGSQPAVVDENGFTKPLSAEFFGHQEKDPLDPAGYTDAELLELDDDFWNAIVGPVKPGMDKRLLGLAMKRRARSKGGA
jgi:hypothetical protein